MLISDWCSDLCSSDLTVLEPEAGVPGLPLSRAGRGQLDAVLRLLYVLLLHLVCVAPFFAFFCFCFLRRRVQIILFPLSFLPKAVFALIGGGSCRERVCQYV